MKDERIIKLGNALKEINYSEEAQKERNETFEEAKEKLKQIYYELIDVELSLTDYYELFNYELMFDTIDLVSDLRKEIDITLSILE